MAATFLSFVKMIQANFGTLQKQNLIKYFHLTFNLTKPPITSISLSNYWIDVNTKYSQNIE